MMAGKITIPIISVVGRSESGKTTLIEKMIPELKRRGYRVGTIKHHVHGFETDVLGKDSYRHQKAGSDLTVLSTPEKIAVFIKVDHDHGLREIREKIFNDREIDIILSEGYKSNPFPKIEVFRKELHQSLLSSAGQGLFAIASNCEMNADVPVYDIDDAKGLADLLDEKFLRES